VNRLKFTSKSNVWGLKRQPLVHRSKRNGTAFCLSQSYNISDRSKIPRNSPGIGELHSETTRWNDCLSSKCMYCTLVLATGLNSCWHWTSAFAAGRFHHIQLVSSFGYYSIWIL